MQLLIINLLVFILDICLKQYTYLLVLFVVTEKNSIGSAQIISQISIFAFGAQKLLPSLQNIYASLSAMKHMASNADNLLEIIQKIEIVNLI